MVSTASSAPETTTDDGPLMAAIDTPSVRYGRISSSVARIATIAPPPGSACISRPRAATSAQASPNENTPATCAAATSPIECPATKSAWTPHDSASRYSATSMANSPACAYAVWFSSSASSPQTTSRRGRSRCSSNAAHTASNASAKTG